MHRSVLQNDGYIKFADEHTVEVMALGSLQRGIDAEDPKAATYEAKDDNGNDVEYLVEFPGLTVDEMKALNASPAGRLNDTGAVPYTCIVNPHTLEKMQAWKGGQSSKTIMDAVLEARKILGPGLSRSALRKFQAEIAEIDKVLADKGVAKALAKFKKVERFAEKAGEQLEERAKAYFESTLMVAASKELDEIEAAIDAGDVGSAKRALRALARKLKDTPLAERANALKERTSS